MLPSLPDMGMEMAMAGCLGKSAAILASSLGVSTREALAREAKSGLVLRRLEAAVIKNHLGKRIEQRPKF